MTWNLLCILAFVFGIHPPPVKSPHKEQVIQNFDGFFVFSRNKLLWRHCDVWLWSVKQPESIKTGVHWLQMQTLAITHWGEKDSGHSMMTSSNGNIFRVTGPLRGNSPVAGEFPSQTPVTWSFYVFFGLRLNKRLRKQSRRWWFETPSLWRHCNGGDGKHGGQMGMDIGGAHVDGLVQERRNSSALAMELHISCTNPSILIK